MGFGKHHQHANFEVAIFSRCKNIKGEPQFWEAPLAHDHADFSSGCDFMMGLGKTKLHIKLEFASFSRYRYIKGGPHNFGELPIPGPRPLFIWVKFYDEPWQTQAAYQI